MTGRRPYDVAVAAVLLRVATRVPSAFTVSSDGGWNTDWQQTRTVAGLTLPSPRRLLSVLFDVRPTADPLPPAASR